MGLKELEPAAQATASNTRRHSFAEGQSGLPQTRPALAPGHTEARLKTQIHHAIAGSRADHLMRTRQARHASQRPGRTGAAGHARSKVPDAGGHRGEGRPEEPSFDAPWKAFTEPARRQEMA